MPLVVLEAGAAELPVVVTGVGGTTEIVEDGTNEYLVPPGDEEALAAAMVRMQELSASERESMGRAGRELVLHNYDIEVVLDRWEAFYQELMAAHSRERGG